ncbi:MAG: hypothetical protein V7607_5647 [Solirubrobacteraceae bacterium]
MSADVGSGSAERADVIVECRDVHVQYEQRGAGRSGDATVNALRGVTLAVRDGETVGIVGESGSGKSTLVRALIGHATPTHGVVVHHPSGADGRPLGARVGMIFQDPKSSVNPRLSIAAIVADPLVVHRWGDRATRAGKVTELLASVGLPDSVARRKARHLSGGQLQRVAIARALALGPDLVLADEPTSALDVSIQAQVVNLLCALKRERRFSMVVVSHDIRVIRALADRVVVMYDGLVVEEGPVDEVFERPKHPYTLTLVASATTVSKDTDVVAHDAAHLLGLPRPLGDVAARQRACCPFTDRCWQARETCTAEVPRLRGDVAGVRCVVPLDMAARSQALGVSEHVAR